MAERMTRPDIDAMEALLGGVTSSWRTFSRQPGEVGLEDDYGMLFSVSNERLPVTTHAVADFIAAARTFAPEVIAYVRTLEARLTDYEGALGFSDDGHLYPEGDVSEKCICPGGHQ